MGRRLRLVWALLLLLPLLASCAVSRAVEEQITNFAVKDLTAAERNMAEFKDIISPDSLSCLILAKQYIERVSKISQQERVGLATVMVRGHIYAQLTDDFVASAQGVCSSAAVQVVVLIGQGVR